MGIEIPGSLQWVAKYVVGAGDWPKGDETAMRRISTAWGTLATALTELETDSDQTVKAALTALSSGQTHDAINDYWAKFVGDKGALTQMISSAKALSQDLEDGAADIEHTKYTIIAALVIFAIQMAQAIATAATVVGAPAAAAEEAGFQVATRVAIRMAIKKLIEKMVSREGLKELGIDALKNAGLGMAMGAGVDLGATGLQIAQGHRGGMTKQEWENVGREAISGAVGGAAGGALSVGGELSEAAGSKIGKFATQAVTDAAGNAVGSIAGTAATVPFGGKFEVDPTTLATSSLGGGAMGAMGGHHPSGTEHSSAETHSDGSAETSSPDETATHDTDAATQPSSHETDALSSSSRDSGSPTESSSHDASSPTEPSSDESGSPTEPSSDESGSSTQPTSGESSASTESSSHDSSDATQPSSHDSEASAQSTAQTSDTSAPNDTQPSHDAPAQHDSSPATDTQNTASNGHDQSATHDAGSTDPAPRASSLNLPPHEFPAPSHDASSIATDSGTAQIDAAQHQDSPAAPSETATSPDSGTNTPGISHDSVGSAPADQHSGDPGYSTGSGTDQSHSPDSGTSAVATQDISASVAESDSRSESSATPEDARTSTAASTDAAPPTASPGGMPSMGGAGGLGGAGGAGASEGHTTSIPSHTPVSTTPTRPETAPLRPESPAATTRPDTPSRPDPAARPDAASRPGSAARPDTPSRPDSTARSDAPSRPVASPRADTLSRPDTGRPDPGARHGSSVRPDAASRPDAATRPDAASRPDTATRPDTAARPNSDVGARPDSGTRPDPAARPEPARTDRPGDTPRPDPARTPPHDTTRPDSRDPSSPEPGRPESAAPRPEESPSRPDTPHTDPEHTPPEHEPTSERPTTEDEPKSSAHHHDPPSEPKHEPEPERPNTADRNRDTPADDAHPPSKPDDRRPATPERPSSDIRPPDRRERPEPPRAEAPRVPENRPRPIADHPTPHRDADPRPTPIKIPGEHLTRAPESTPLPRPATPDRPHTPTAPHAEPARRPPDPRSPGTEHPPGTPAYADPGRPAPGYAHPNAPHPGAPVRNAPHVPYEGHHEPDGYRHFATDEAGERYGENRLGHVLQNLPPALREAAHWYTRQSLPNQFLRGNDPLGNVARHFQYLHNESQGVHALSALNRGRMPETARDLRRMLRNSQATEFQREWMRYVLSMPEPSERLANMVENHATNNFLHDYFGGKPTADAFSRRLGELDAALSHPLPEPVQAVRGLHDISFLKDAHGHPLGTRDPRELIGAEQVDRGYMSSSLGENPTVVDNRPFGYKMKLDLPQGTHGLWMGRSSAYWDQRELILPRDTQYRITGVVQTGWIQAMRPDGRFEDRPVYEIHAEVVPHSPPSFEALPHHDAPASYAPTRPDGPIGGGRVPTLPRPVEPVAGITAPDPGARPVAHEMPTSGTHSGPERPSIPRPFRSEEVPSARPNTSPVERAGSVPRSDATPPSRPDGARFDSSHKDETSAPPARINAVEPVRPLDSDSRVSPETVASPRENTGFDRRSPADSSPASRPEPIRDNPASPVNRDAPELVPRDSNPAEARPESVTRPTNDTGQIDTGSANRPAEHPAVRREPNERRPEPEPPSWLKEDSEPRPPVDDVPGRAVPKLDNERTPRDGELESDSSPRRPEGQRDPVRTEDDSVAPRRSGVADRDRGSSGSPVNEASDRGAVPKPDDEQAPHDVEPEDAVPDRSVGSDRGRSGWSLDLEEPKWAPGERERAGFPADRPSELGENHPMGPSGPRREPETSGPHDPLDNRPDSGPRDHPDRGSSGPEHPVSPVPVHDEQPSRSAESKPSLRDLFPPHGLPVDEARVLPQFRRVIDGEYGGLRISVDNVEGNSERMIVRSRIYDAAGNEVGQVRRYFQQVEGRLTVHHDSFWLNKNVRGQGCSTEFNKAMIDWYRDSGVKEITLVANKDVGCYAWARQKFDFAIQHEAVNKFGGRLGRELAAEKLKLEGFLSNYILLPDGSEKETLSADIIKQTEFIRKIENLCKRFQVGAADFPTAKEIADLGRPGDLLPGESRELSWLGKRVFLEPKALDWRGVMNLEEAAR